MKRFVTITIILLILCVVFCSCQSSMSMRGTAPKAESPIAEYFKGKNAVVQKDTITLMENFGVGDSIEFANNELWTINLNGYSIYSTAEGPCFRIVSGGVILKNVVEGEEVRSGGIYSYNTGVYVGTEGSFQILGGEIRAEEYAVEVARAGVLRVAGGALIGYKSPLLLEKGWSGQFTGGFFSAYEKEYSIAVPGNYYLSLMRDDSNIDYFSEFKTGFEIKKESWYSGASQLELTSPSDRDTCYRLYRPKNLYSYFGQKATPAYQWFVKAGQKETVAFTSGEYVMKVAEGTEWTDDKAYGLKGRYWKMTPYTFKDSHAYAIEEGGDMQRGSNMEDFLTNAASK